LTA
jgi:hypothetical protein